MLVFAQAVPNIYDLAKSAHILMSFVTTIIIWLCVHLVIIYYRESFDLRAPKRKSGVKEIKVYEQLPTSYNDIYEQIPYRPTISNRPPPPLPCTAKTEPTTETEPNDDSDYATLDDFLVSDDNFSWCNNTTVNTTYEYVQRRPNKGLRPNSAAAVVTRGRNFL